MVGWITGTRAMFGIHLLVAVVVFVYFAVAERGGSDGSSNHKRANIDISLSNNRRQQPTRVRRTNGGSGTTLSRSIVNATVKKLFPPPGIAAEILRELPRHRGGLQSWGQIKFQTLQVPKRLPL